MVFAGIVTVSEIDGFARVEGVNGETDLPVYMDLSHESIRQNASLFPAKL